MRARALQIVAAAILLASAHPAAAAPPFSIEDLQALRRLGRFALRPDGREVVIEVATIDIASNKEPRHLCIVPAAGGDPRPLTNGPSSESDPVWTPDSKTVLFVADRGEGAQIWAIGGSGGEAQRLTSAPGGAESPAASADGKWIAFLADAPPASTSQTAPAGTHSPRRHVFAVPSTGGDARDLTPGAVRVRDFCFSQDSREICFVAVASGGADDGLFVADLAAGTTRRIADSALSASQPRCSPDGRFLASLAHNKTGDRPTLRTIQLYDKSSKSWRSMTDSLDRDVDRFEFAPDSRSIFFTCLDAGHRILCSLSLPKGEIRKLVIDRNVLQIRPGRGELYFSSDSLGEPAQLFACSWHGKSVRRLTSLDSERVAGFKLAAGESISYPGAGGTPVQGWIVKPSGFDPARRYPLIVLIHDPLHGASQDSFDSGGWNVQVLANSGPFVVFLPNPRGSGGFGQKFAEATRKDWGGKAYIDIMLGVEVMAHRPEIDPTRMAAIGGTMANWIAGRTEMFRVIVSHAGIYNLVSEYGTTDDPGWLEAELGGTPWESAETYATFSPSANAATFRTPMLLTHGDLDTLVPPSESRQLLTTLQRRGIACDRLTSPDEGHVIRKPANVRLWYTTVLSWLCRYLLESVN